MSVFKRKGSRVFEYDFWLAGRRFFGNTGCTSRSEAKVHEDQVRAEARAAVKQAGAEAPLTLDTAIGRYWIEHGRAQKNADDLKRDFRRLMDRLGPQRLLSDITDDDVAKLVAWRRGHHVHDDPNRPLISNAQVNRTVTEMLRRLFVRARKKWKVRFDTEPDWGEHLLAEPAERVRELRPDEDAALALALDPDYEAVRRFSLASGLRQAESLLHWRQVDLAARRIATVGKGGRPVFLPITSAMEAILASRIGHHPEYVFTYVAARTVKPGSGAGAGVPRQRGQRYPITPHGLKTHWRRRRSRAGVADFRWHDNRHDFATKLLRATENLKLVQRGLNHANVTTTVKYAHVLDDELRAGMEAMSVAPSKESPEKSPDAARKRSAKGL